MKAVRTTPLLLSGALPIALAGCANTGAKTGTYLDDSLISSKVKSEMAANKDVTARNITVDTNFGGVTLAGTAATARESEKAGQIAQDVAGVKSVRNGIQVR